MSWVQRSRLSSQGRKSKQSIWGELGAGGPCFSCPASLPVILFTSFLLWFWVQTQSSFSVLFPPTSYSQGLLHGLTTCSANDVQIWASCPGSPSPHIAAPQEGCTISWLSVFSDPSSLSTMSSGPFTATGFQAIAPSFSQALKFKTLRIIFSFSPSSLLSIPCLHEWMKETTIHHGFSFS